MPWWAPPHAGNAPTTGSSRDPARAAQVLLALASMDAPPLRLALGSDAFAAISAADAARLAERDRWRALSESTDFAL